MSAARAGFTRARRPCSACSFGRRRDLISTSTSSPHLFRLILSTRSPKIRTLAARRSTHTSRRPAPSRSRRIRTDKPTPKPTKSPTKKPVSFDNWVATDNDIKQAVKLWCRDPEDALARYGVPIEDYARRRVGAAPRDDGLGHKPPDPATSHAVALRGREPCPPYLTSRIWTRRPRTPLPRQEEASR